MEDKNSVLEFWFGSDADDMVTAGTQSRLWWSKDESIDADIKKRFASWSDAAISGKLKDWQGDAAGQLALIILCDQFPRNMYRNTPQAFAFDAAAREFCKAGLASGLDQQLRPIQRVFFYLPLEHSESLADQDRAVALYEALRTAVSTGQGETFEGFYRFAIKHREVIQRFGRFPHRNSILGRQSTAEELQFLSGPGSSF
ncbi:DUF924 family protein [Undibacterium sp. TS12]|uniref:DUF924 family protein n=1 Tax=Undibacterium sp. TS12 TaxID=2908202 RepID=UPI001F4CB2B9|nr:DUF924 family protein [Undibacterium sp. TS12]MCH8620794.1 DUF924 domain-containing protein [Undibacterium sp. TS12]